MPENHVLQSIPGLSLKRLPVEEAPGSPAAPGLSSSCIKGAAKGEGWRKGDGKAGSQVGKGLTARCRQGHWS